MIITLIVMAGMHVSPLAGRASPYAATSWRTRDLFPDRRPLAAACSSAFLDRPSGPGRRSPSTSSTTSASQSSRYDRAARFLGSAGSTVLLVVGFVVGLMEMWEVEVPCVDFPGLPVHADRRAPDRRP